MNKARGDEPEPSRALRQRNKGENAKPKEGMSQSQKQHARLLVLSSFDQSIPAGMQQRGKNHRAEHQPSHRALTK